PWLLQARQWNAAAPVDKKRRPKPLSLNTPASGQHEWEQGAPEGAQPVLHRCGRCWSRRPRPAEFYKTSDIAGSDRRTLIGTSRLWSWRALAVRRRPITRKRPHVFRLKAGATGPSASRRLRRRNDRLAVTRINRCRSALRRPQPPRAATHARRCHVFGLGDRSHFCLGFRRSRWEREATRRSRRRRKKESIF
uniref:Integron gene cassette protein n=1 Tax=Macrostomum lignano TaxID=282301 RepID=A0A1I8FRI4_9PLAT